VLLLGKFGKKWQGENTMRKKCMGTALNSLECCFRAVWLSETVIKMFPFGPYFFKKIELCQLLNGEVVSPVIAWLVQFRHIENGRS
jgi:hypothetical protein